MFAYLEEDDRGGGIVSKMFRGIWEKRRRAVVLGRIGSGHTTEIE